MQSHRYYKQAYDAHRGTSFSPDVRAVSELQYFDSVLVTLKDIHKEDAIAGFEKLWLKWMNAKSRVMSTMITGGGNFPVARMQKYNRWERSASENVSNFLKKVTSPPPPPRTELNYDISEKKYDLNGVTVWQNVELNRLQLLFNGKPDDDMIVKLKKSGFKWSPRNKAWQRQLTPNALRVVPYILKIEE